MKKLLTLLILTVAIYSCGEKKSTTENNQIEVDSKTFKNRWPFTVEKGIIKCIQYNVEGVSPELTRGVVFEANNKTYAVNGFALTNAVEYGYSEIEEIWAFDEESTKALIDMGFSKEEAESQKTRVTIAPIIEEGLKLCK